MKKRLPALVLTLALCLTPAMAAGTADKFPAKNTYAGFSDVADNHWALSGIKICYETGLMNGKGKGFDPAGTVTVAEAAALAARLGSALTGTPIPQPADAEWFIGSCQYVHALATKAENTYVTDLLSEPMESATRADLFYMLALAVPQSSLPAKNSITALPDTDDAELLRFYNAGVLTGVNAFGTFLPGKTLTRQELAAMVSRIARPETAQAFTPKTKDDPTFEPIAYYTGYSKDTVILTGEDISITLGEFLPVFLEMGDQLAQSCAEQNLSFAWENSVGDQDFVSYARIQAINKLILLRWEAAHGSDTYDTSAALGAKHILVETKAEADELRAQLKAAGDTAAKFDELMAAHSTDPGSKSQPNGYTFGPGKMVSEFEAGTKALKIDEISQPIQSQFGYHIILRIAPDLDAYRDSLLDTAYNVWWDTKGFSYTDAMQTVDEADFYDRYTAGLTK